MPYRSAKQRAYLHIHEPEIAARWDREYGGKLAGKLEKADQKRRGARRTRRTRSARP